MTQEVAFDTLHQQIGVFGAFDANVKIIEKAFGVTVHAGDTSGCVTGESERVHAAAQALSALKKIYANGEHITADSVHRVVAMLADGTPDDIAAAIKDVIVVTHRGQPVKCRTIGQKRYMEALEKNTVTICIGPAGTGKTFLAVAKAVAALRSAEVERIIMSRPAIEAGEERLGFLPGDLAQKVDPYLRPLYDALNDIMGTEQVNKYMERGIIEVAPLAYMRGRTLNRAMIIIDESQNASLLTLKMALTRLGEGSKMILTGDVTQIDLPRQTDSGLEKCARILENINSVAVERLTDRDVVRHRLVRDIVKAFEINKKLECRMQK